MTVKFKLDENLANRHFLALEAADHDVSTVMRQGISGASDIDLYSLCRREGRALVTLDLDFSNVFEFPPGGNSRNYSTSSPEFADNNRQWPD